MVAGFGCVAQGVGAAKRPGRCGRWWGPAAALDGVGDVGGLGAVGEVVRVDAAAVSDDGPAGGAVVCEEWSGVGGDDGWVWWSEASVTAVGFESAGPDPAPVGVVDEHGGGEPLA